MSLTAPAHARNLQTNINQGRYFFATQEAGEQELFLSTIVGGGPNGNISSLAVGISGPAGNAVVVSEGPSYMASEFVLSDQGAIFGAGSTYWTGSTIASTISGINLSSDRVPGSGVACIESYGTNGSFLGFEFLSRGPESQLISTGMDSFLGSIGRPGATAVLGATGTFAANTLTFQNMTVPLNNPSSLSAQVQVYPASKTNAEFGAEGKTEILAGANSNAALYGQVWAPLFSTPMTGLNPNGQTFLSINFANALSSGSNHVNYKIGFSTATAYTNVVTTTYVPGSQGTWTPSDLPGLSSPIGHTLVTCCLDSDGVNADGTGMLYVLGQFSDPTAPADQIFIAKGEITEPTRNALVWRPI